VFPGLPADFVEKFSDGTEHFNSRRFFESHESWEEIWLKSEGAERRRLQGLIQIAAAFHHHSRANLEGTESLLRAGLEKISDAPAHHWGLNLGLLRSEVKKWLRVLEAKKPVASKIPPRLKPAGRRG
jgi:predicted metal-dependent hydrolase